MSEGSVEAARNENGPPFGGPFYRLWLPGSEADVGAVGIGNDHRAAAAIIGLVPGVATILAVAILAPCRTGRRFGTQGRVDDHPHGRFKTEQGQKPEIDGSDGSDFRERGGGDQADGEQNGEGEQFLHRGPFHGLGSPDARG